MRRSSASTKRPPFRHSIALTRSSRSRRAVPNDTDSIHRHGTLSLYAALNTQTGEVVGHTAARHTSDDFCSQQVVATQLRGREIHIILTTRDAQDAEGPHLRDALPYSCITHVFVVLNQLELWFADRARHSGARHLYSVADLCRKILRYIFVPIPPRPCSGGPRGPHTADSLMLYNCRAWSTRGCNA